MKSTKKATKPAAKMRSKRKAPPAEKKQSGLKHLLFGEEKPDLTELESGSTTILDILSPTAVDTKSRDWRGDQPDFHRQAAAQG